MSSILDVKFGDYTLKLTPEILALGVDCKKWYYDAESVIHRFGHIERVALGAAWFVEVMGGDEREQQLAYAAGLLHDIVRPITEVRCHAEDSAKMGNQILNNRDYGLDPNEILIICDAVRDHRRPSENWNSRVHLAPYLADKIFEHMGPYLIFRAAAWAGELVREDEEYEGMNPITAFGKYYRDASHKIAPDKFPLFVSGLVSYQLEPIKMFENAFYSSEPWALKLVEDFFAVGKEKMDFDEFLNDYEPENNDATKLLDDALAYVSGKKLGDYRSLIDLNKILYFDSSATNNN